MQRTEKAIEIHAPVERVFDLFSDFENFPRWMKHIKEVRYTGRRYTKWTADAPLGIDVEWEAETTVFEPDHRIAWRSVRGDVDTDGEVIFEETRRGTTLMRVLLGYDPPAGRFGAMVASLFGKNPERQLEEDLERFAHVAESRGRRVASRVRHDEERGDARARREYVREQLERRRRERDQYGDRAISHSPRPERHPRDARLRYDDRAGRYRSQDDREERVEYREREARFEQALRDARRSQQENYRRYIEDRERDERRRFEDEYRRDDRRRVGDERSGERPLQRRDEGLIDEPAPRYTADDRRPAPPRYALTPRERELERSRRRPDYEASKRAFRRGVDKLMDEPPSNRWRR